MEKNDWSNLDAKSALDLFRTSKEHDISNFITFLKVQCVKDFDFLYELRAAGGLKILCKILEEKDLSENETFAIDNIIEMLVNTDFSIEKYRKPSLEFNYSDVSISLREVRSSMVGKGQKSVGYIMWTSAKVLSNWISINADVVKGKDVLEIGAGLGLCGILIGHYAKSVTLSDYNCDVLHALVSNVENNKNTCGCSTKSIPSDCTTKVVFYDWNVTSSEPLSSFQYFPLSKVGVHGIGERIDMYNPDYIKKCQSNLDSRCQIKYDKALNKIVKKDMLGKCDTRCSSDTDEILDVDIKDGMVSSSECLCQDAVHYSCCSIHEPLSMDRTFELIIGSDLVCCIEDALCVARTLQRFLAPSGLAIMVISQPQHRFGTDALIPALLSSFDLEVYWRSIVSNKVISLFAPEYLEDRNYLLGSVMSLSTEGYPVRTDSRYDDIDPVTLENVFDINEKLLVGVEDKDYQGWDLIIVKKR